MNILFTRFPLESRFGGAEVQTLALMKELRERGHEVMFLGSCPVLLEETKKCGMRNAECEMGIPPVTKVGALSFLWKRFAMKKKLHSQFSILHSQFHFDAVIMLSLSEKLLLTPFLHKHDVKVVWVEHDRVSRWLTKNPWLPTLRRFSRLATTVVVSDSSKQIYEKMGFQNVVAIPNGMDVSRLASDQSPIAHRPSPTLRRLRRIFCTERYAGETINNPSERAGLVGPAREDTFEGKVGSREKNRQVVLPRLLSIGTLARLSHDKGVDVLMEAVKDLPDIGLTIVGTGPEALALQVASFSLPHCYILPRVDNLHDFYTSLNLFVLPSREHDPFGLVAGEAMMLGVPTIVTDACGIAGYLNNGQDAVIVPAGSVEKLREAIAELANNPSKRAAIGSQGKMAVERLFSMERMVEKYEGILRSPLLIFFTLVTFLLVPVSANAAQSHRIIPRAEWGADDSFLYVQEESTTEKEIDAQEKTSEPDTIPQRQKDCEENRKLYPEEFVPTRTFRKDANGRIYRWALQYSRDVKLLVVHHTAIQVMGDDRTSEERMRALYEMHANERGWGDIGYHYVISDDGKIFEGKSGGDYVVGGQVYCGNIGTIGVALMGNFEIEKPTQAQMRSLQWLLIRLTKRYRINLERTVRFHGTATLPVVGHRDLLPTDCPGYYVGETLNQVRANVAHNDHSTPIRFPVVAKSKSAGILAKRQKERLGLARNEVATGITAVGGTTIEGRPGDTAIFLMQYRSGSTEVGRRTRIAAVSRSSGIGLSQELGGRDIAVRTDLLLPESLPPRSAQSIRLKVQYPTEPGTYSLTIGEVAYTLEVQGRRARTDQPLSVTGEKLHVVDCKRSCNLQLATSIRIRLSSREHNETNCAAIDLRKLKTQYRGTMECTMIEGKAAIIHTIDLENYLAGLAEEPDTESYEKQRAFAIAARTYAAFYLDPTQRKFPGMPYDGDDSPERFQSYKGIAFTLRNPQWVKAVRSTANKVLMIDGVLIKPPYFSSDDGRTRSPAEAGWKNFPHADTFGSKPDPWCKGMPISGHGVGMSGCGARGQAEEGKTAEHILGYYYPKTIIIDMTELSD